MSDLHGVRFITVDLEVWSREDLGALATAVEQHGVVQHVGRVRRKFFLSIVAKWAKPRSSPEQTIWDLLEVVGALSPKASRLWRRAEPRVFNIGFDGGDFLTLFYERPAGSGRWYPGGRKKARPCETFLSPDLLRAVAKVKGTIATTIYPPGRQVRSRRFGRRSSAPTRGPG